MYKIKLLIVICLVSSLKLLAQNNAYEQLNTKLLQYVSDNYQEKVFVHTDRDFYLSGETIWFKVYNTAAATNKLSTLSKIVYVEIINADKKAVMQATIELQDGTGNGQFVLPLTLATGNYVFRAYTNWMKNYSEELVFHQKISIVNVFEKNNDTATPIKQYDIQFFPEGGNLVNNIQSKIAFKAVNQFGKGINFNGTIINQQNEIIASFAPQQFGIGTFLFTPITNQTYKAVIVTESNDTLHYTLPTAFDNGYVITTDATEKFVSITVNASENYNNESVYLIAHNNQVISYKQWQNLQNGKVVFNIDKDILQNGVNYFTLFNSNSKPVCERLYYKRPANTDLITTKINQQQFTNREKVNIALTSFNTQKQPVNANMSVAVFKTDELQHASTIDIQQYLWLTSNLQGTIENAEYYLNTNTEASNKALDNLLLTQGWRRFNWNEILESSSTAKKYLPEYESQLITGRVVNKTTLSPVAGIGVYLSIPGKEFGFAAAQSNQQGDFIAVMPKVSNKTELVVQTNNRTDSNYRIDINSPYWSKETTFNTPHFSLNNSIENELNNYSINMQAENIYAKKPTAIQTFNYKPFYVTADESYLLDNYTRFTTMEEVMREYIPGVNVRKKAGKFVFYNVDASRFQYFNSEPLVLVDGIPVFDADNMMATNPLKIQKIDVVTRKFYQSAYAFDGIISYASYTGKLGTSLLNKESLLIEYNAIQQQREFYVPKYELKEQKESRVPDYRMLLHWSPNVSTDANGNTNIEFYTSDIVGNFTAIIQGITKDGEPVKSAIQFSVTK